MSDIRSRVTEMLESNPATDPTRIADAILRKASPEDMRRWVPFLMRTYVVYVMRHVRNAAISGLETAEADEANRRPEGPAKPNRSAKRDGIRSHYQKLIGARICVGERWTTVGALTMDDCTAVAADRHKKAEELTATADRYEALAKALADHGVKTVSELPEAAVEEAFA